MGTFTKEKSDNVVALHYTTQRDQEVYDFF